MSNEACYECGADLCFDEHGTCDLCRHSSDIEQEHSVRSSQQGYGFEKWIDANGQ